MAHHNLKISPEYYNPMASGEKTFELRFNDRDYQVGDTAEFRAWDNGYYLELPPLVFKITFVLDNKRYLQEGYVALGIQRLEAE